MTSLTLYTSLFLLLPLLVRAAPVTPHKHDAAPAHAHGRNRFVQAAVNDGWVIQDQSDRYHPGVQVVMDEALFKKKGEQADESKKKNKKKASEAVFVRKKDKDASKEQADKKKKKDKDATKEAVKKKEQKEEMGKGWYQEHDKHADGRMRDTVPVVMPGSEKAGEVFEMGKGGVKKTSKDGKARAIQRKESMMKEWYENAPKLVKQDGTGNGQMYGALKDKPQQ